MTENPSVVWPSAAADANEVSAMSFTWTRIEHGWADCIVADGHAEAEATASYITLAPDEFLEAVTRVVLQFGESRAEFEAEPTVFRWIFYREGSQVWVLLLRLPHRQAHDNSGTELWSSWQTVDSLARAVVRGFDRVLADFGESRYQDKWRHPFPSSQLQRLREAWRQFRIDTEDGR